MKKIIGLGIIGFILVVGSINARAASTVPSDGVLYSDSGKTVKEALDELFTGLKEKQTEIDNLKKVGDATAEYIVSGKTALVQGKTVTGTIPNRTSVSAAKATGVTDVVGLNSSNFSNVAVSPYAGSLHWTVNSDGVSRLALRVPHGLYGGTSLSAYNDGDGYVGIGTDAFGNATTSQVLSGSTFTSTSGLKISGTMVNNGYGGDASKLILSTDNNLYYRIPVGYYSLNPNTNLSEVKASYSSVATAIGLTAVKLAKGQTVLGIQGTYVCASDTTASAADIVSGKTAYVSGNKVTGTASRTKVVTKTESYTIPKKASDGGMYAYNIRSTTIESLLGFVPTYEMIIFHCSTTSDGNADRDLIAYKIGDWIYHPTYSVSSSTPKATTTVAKGNSYTNVVTPPYFKLFNNTSSPLYVKGYTIVGVE